MNPTNTLMRRRWLFSLTFIVNLASSASVATDKSTVQQLIEELEITKVVDQGIENSGILFQKTPKDPNPNVQKKIDQLYRKAAEDFNQQKLALKQKTKSEITDLMSKKFSPEEIKYLLTIAKYPVYKKLRVFLDSEEYNKILITPYNQNKETTEKIKAQIKTLNVNQKK